MPGGEDINLKRKANSVSQAYVSSLASASNQLDPRKLKVAPGPDPKLKGIDFYVTVGLNKVVGKWVPSHPSVTCNGRCIFDEDTCELRHLINCT